MNSRGLARLPTPSVPRTAIAFRFFDPITAPTPERPAARCRSLTTAAYSTWFSPAPPMLETRTSGSCSCVLSSLLGLPDGLAPQVRGVAQLGLAVLDEQIHRLAARALEDDHVPAGHLELGAPVAARVRACDRAGQRALGDHRVAPAGRRHRAGQRPGGPDDLVVRRQRIDGRVDFLGSGICWPGRASRGTGAPTPCSAVRT